MFFCCYCRVEDKFSEKIQQSSFSFWLAITETWKLSMRAAFMFRVCCKVLLFILYYLVKILVIFK